MDDFDRAIVIIGLMAALSLSWARTFYEIHRLRSWWRNRGWRAGMQIRLDEVRKEYDQMEEFILAIKEGLAGRGILKATLGNARAKDPGFGNIFIRFLEGTLEEIEEEGREIERAIREL